MVVVELFLQKKPNHHSTEVLRHSLDIPEGDMVKPALHHNAVVMRIPPQELAAGPVGKDHFGPDRPFRRFVVEPLEDGKDEPGTWGR